MNLYIFNQTRRGSEFGVGTYMHELTTVLKDCDINVCVINLISEKPQIQVEEIEGVKYWYFPLAIYDLRTTSKQKQWELYYCNVVYLLRLYIKEKNDLIFQLNFSDSGILVEKLKKTFDCKILAINHFFDWALTIHDNPQRFRHILKKEYPDSIEENLQTSFEGEMLYYFNVDHIICLSDYMKNILCIDYGIDAAKISVIPNGLSDEAKIAVSTKSLRRKWNIRPKEKIIFFAGRIDEVKGVIYLIKAFREVLKTNSNCRLIIAGSGNYDECFKESKNICSKITYTGLLERHDLYELYQIADIGVIPSLFEPFGYVAVEAMMHKLPIVVTATSGLNEVVDDSCGLKVPINVLPDSVEIDTVLLSEKILYLLENSIEARLMSGNGRRRFLCNYSSKIFRENMLRIYKSICI